MMSEITIEQFHLQLLDQLLGESAKMNTRVVTHLTCHQEDEIYKEICDKALALNIAISKHFNRSKDNGGLK